MLRPAFRASGCASCRSSLLRAFIGRPIVPRIGRADPTSPTTSTNPLPIRPFSNAAVRKVNVQPEHQSDENEDLELKKETSNAVEDEEELPWYLEVEPPRHPTLIPEHQEIPAAPEGSPRLMEPLLKFVATDLGLDDLNLLDLRSLDPPPALGPQLMMLFGTARSQRHLHVSADRLVRWLRGRGMAATADGLLGRNELKTKLRRKARRAKLMGNTGAPGEDDGIATRWICVNLGTIGWSAEETKIVGSDGRVSGFGSAQTGTTIVVQIFTADKRQELELETLWTRILKRSKANNSYGDELEYIEHRSDPKTAAMETAISDLEAKPKEMSQPSSRRFYSTSARPSKTTFDVANGITQPVLGMSELKEISESLAYDSTQKKQLLERLRSHLTGLSHQEAVEALRQDQETVFRRLCNLAMQGLPRSETWELRAFLHATALLLRHAHYNYGGLRDLVEEMIQSGIVTSRDQLLTLLKAIFCGSSREDTNLRDQLELAMKLLQNMYERGEEILANDVMVTMIEALARPGGSSLETEELQQVLEKLRHQAKFPCLDESSIMRLLDAYALQENWDRFWEIWRMPPKFRQPRSPQLYTYLYRRVAQTEHQARCIDAIRWCFHEMMSEDPPVEPTGDVSEALMESIRIADPHAERHAQRQQHRGNWEMGEFGRMVLSLKATHR